MQQWVVYLAAVLVTVLMSLGNIGLKAISGTLAAVVAGVRVLDFHPFMAAFPRIFLVGCVYVLGAGLWMWVLNNLPLNRAFMFVSLTFIFVPVLSRLLLNEEIGWGVIVGTPVIIVGLLTAILLG